ncbi:response regulator [Pseudanabaena sp. BC1403]|uniref:response regulator n=1 Tax=Pseudanabaena sp. BC1403 TaxID=2043171 RepID=UPI000CD99836|nr:response regulator [Pseudanabaena sp. BC1403]
MSNAKTILIVDDDKNDRLLFRQYIECDLDNSYRILEAETLTQGLELWRSQKPDATLVDIGLPDGNGIVLVETMRDHAQSNNIEQALDLKLPVIMLTGSEDARNAVSKMRLGAYEYLIKNDITQYSLQQSIRSLLEYFTLARQLERVCRGKELVSQIALNIRQFINLEDICQSVVQEISKFLQTDRTLIYKFDEDMSRRIIAEAVVPPFPACLDFGGEDLCAHLSEEQLNECLDGKIFANSDIHSADFLECHVQMLDGFQVQANVIAPILLAVPLSNSSASNNQSNNQLNNRQNTQTLWGLLIVHQCSRTRDWEEDEIKLLQQLSVQLAIAIQQAEVYQNPSGSLALQVQNKTSELQASEHKLRSILNGIPDIINLISIDGTYLESKQDKPSYDFIPAHIHSIGKNIVDLLPLELATTQIQAIQQAVSSGEMLTIDQTYQTSDGQHYEEVRVVPIDNNAAVVVIRDNTDHRRAEESLRVSEEKLQKIALSSPVIIEIFVQRADGSAYFEYLSPAHEEIHELKVTQILQNPQLFFEQIHPDDMANFWEVVGTSFETSSILRHEWRIITPSGKLKWLRSNLRPERRTNGDTAWYGIISDISDRKQIEINLEKELIRNKALLTNSFDGILILDGEGNLVECNSSFAAMLGYSLEETTNLSIYDIDVKWTREELERGIQEFNLQSKKVLFETQHRKKDGSICDVEISANSVDWDNNIFQFCICRDITQRKLAEKSLLASMQREQTLNQFIQLIRSSLDLEFVFNTATNAIASLLNLEQAAIIQYIDEKKVWKYIAIFQDRPETSDRIGFEIPDQDNSFATRLKNKEIIQINDTDEIEDEINSELAKNKPGAWLLIPIIANEKIWGSFTIRKVQKPYIWGDDEIVLAQTIANQLAIAIQHVSLYQQLQLELAEHKQTEIALEKAKELAEAANKAKSEFLANMSHEIRTPMNGVLGMAQLLASTPLRDEQKDLVQIILDSGDALLTVINDILDFSKIESGNLQLEQKEFNFEDTINAVCNLLNKQAFDKNTNLQCHVNSMTPTTVVGDSSRLRQILINLIGNAIKFTEQGYISISYDRKFITANTYEFRFSITDTGIGIDRNCIDKLFKPFTQADVSINRQFGGTGLGLAISKRLVELMGGTIWVESRGNVGGNPPSDWVIRSNENTQGSTFHFTIAVPVIAAISTVKAIDNLGSALSNANKISFEKFPIKILIVEDNILNQKIVILMLKRLGCKADTVNNGSECMEVIADQDFNLAYDIIFMDVQMPVMDGLTATRAIRQSSSLRTQPWIIALTADALPEDYKACMSAGMNDYMSKPINTKDIERSLLKYLKNNKS